MTSAEAGSPSPWGARELFAKPRLTFRTSPATPCGGASFVRTYGTLPPSGYLARISFAVFLYCSTVVGRGGAWRWNPATPANPARPAASDSRTMVAFDVGDEVRRAT